MVNKNMGLYIHIPFCSRKCDYCDFVSYSMNKKAQELYLQALVAEIERVKPKFKDRVFDTIYIGGGTPSIMYEGFIVSLSRILHSSFRFADKVEFTIEVNPSSFTKTKFIEYLQAGINRISIGVQCTDVKILADNGRYQSAKDVKNTFKILREGRFSNVSGDVMIGLPHQSQASVLKTIKYLIRQKTKHISVYSLQVEKHTRLYDKIRNGITAPLSESVVLDTYNKACKLLKKNGYLRYEVSNFAKPGMKSKHNMKYWTGAEYLGLGVAAHSYVDGHRYYNTKRLDTYIDKMEKGESPVYSTEYITKEEQRVEYIMLALRTEEGLNLERFKAKFHEDLLETKKQEIDHLLQMKMISIDNGIMKITDNYFYVSNSIMLELI